MSKRKETLEIEDKLYYMCHKKRIYGCEEVTIGFVNSGYGNEIVDFITMDSKGIWKLLSFIYKTVGHTGLA